MWVYVLSHMSVCVYVRVQALNKHESREKMPLVVRKKPDTVHRDKAEISAGIKRCLKDE